MNGRSWPVLGHDGSVLQACETLTEVAVAVVVVVVVHTNHCHHRFNDKYLSC